MSRNTCKGSPGLMKPVVFISVLVAALGLLSCQPSTGPDPAEAGRPGITADPTGGLVTSEGGGADSFTVVLSAAPSSDVTIGLWSSDPAEGVVNPSFLTFTRSNWRIPQTVTVTGVDDAVVDGDRAYTIVTDAAIWSTSDYDCLDVADVSVTNLDDDTEPDVIDQQQPLVDKSVGAASIGGGSEQKLAEVVTAGISGALLAVKLPIGASTGSLVVEIQGVTGDEPNGTVLTSNVFDSSNIPAEEADGFRRFMFSSPADFTAGTRFAIVARSPGGSFCWYEGPEGNPYPGGDGFYDSRPNAPGVWVRLGGRVDLPFKTIVSADVTHGVIEFGACSYAVDEGDGACTIAVTRTMGSVGAASVEYSAGGGSAEAGVDFVAVSGTLTWADGDSGPKTFSVPILEDTVVEPEETVFLSLSGVSGGAILRLPSTRCSP
jgi:hypothetical protein